MVANKNDLVFNCVIKVNGVHAANVMQGCVHGTAMPAIPLNGIDEAPLLDARNEGHVERGRS